MRQTGLKISACLLLIVLKEPCLCFLTQSSTATDVGTSEETSVSPPPNSGSSQDEHGTTLAGNQSNGADNSTNIVDVIDLCMYSIPPAFVRIKNHFIKTFDNKICRGNPMELIQGKAGFKSVNTIITTKMTAKIKRYFRLSSITKKHLMPYYK